MDNLTRREFLTAMGSLTAKPLESKHLPAQETKESGSDKDVLKKLQFETIYGEPELSILHFTRADGKKYWTSPSQGTATMSSPFEFFNRIHICQGKEKIIEGQIWHTHTLAALNKLKRLPDNLLKKFQQDPKSINFSIPPGLSIRNQVFLDGDIFVLLAATSEFHKNVKISAGLAEPGGQWQMEAKLNPGTFSKKYVQLQDEADKLFHPLIFKNQNWLIDLYGTNERANKLVRTRTYLEFCRYLWLNHWDEPVSQEVRKEVPLLVTREDELIKQYAPVFTRASRHIEECMDNPKNNANIHSLRSALVQDFRELGIATTFTPYEWGSLPTT
ncbi:MAG: hypothetical protein M1383_01580 [Patescibacteria group bacterium]|nr:hypothetical protein [Patescibacteria group bacterium]